MLNEYHGSEGKRKVPMRYGRDEFSNFCLFMCVYFSFLGCIMFIYLRLFHLCYIRRTMDKLSLHFFYTSVVTVCTGHTMYFIKKIIKKYV